MPGASIGVSANGWTDSEHAIHWVIHHFDIYTKPSNNQFRLLILDGHESHIFLGFIRACEERRIVPICLPPHSTHLLQPLDVGCFGTLKAVYSNLVNIHARQFDIAKVSKARFLEMYATARSQAFTETNTRNAFKAVGLHPLDPQRVLSKLSNRRDKAQPEIQIYDKASPDWAQCYVRMKRQEIWKLREELDKQKSKKQSTKRVSKGARVLSLRDLNIKRTKKAQDELTKANTSHQQKVAKVEKSHATLLRAYTQTAHSKAQTVYDKAVVAQEASASKVAVAQAVYDAAVNEQQTALSAWTPRSPTLPYLSPYPMVRPLRPLSQPVTSQNPPSKDEIAIETFSSDADSDSDEENMPPLEAMLPENE